jgi:hypothetical protein
MVSALSLLFIARTPLLLLLLLLLLLHFASRQQAPAVSLAQGL